MLECITLDDSLEYEEIMFRAMFNTAFIRSNVLMLTCDELDAVWDAKDHFPGNFRVEVSTYAYFQSLESLTYSNDGFLSFRLDLGYFL